MPRLIEILLFLTPFLGFLTWRLLFPSPLPPLWLTGGLAVFVVLMIAVLLWLRNADSHDAARPYVPARMQDGRIVRTPP